MSETARATVWRRRAERWPITAPPTFYLVVFFLLPALIMLVASFQYPGEFGGLTPAFTSDQSGTRLDITGENYWRFFTDAIYIELFIKSLAYALITTLACLLLGYPLAMMIARSEKKHRDLLLLLVILPFWSNFLIRIYAWIMILGPQAGLSKAVNAIAESLGLGPITLLYSPFAVLVGLTYVHLPFMILPLYANLEKHDPTLLDAAQDLGANAWARFWKVTFPLSLPGVYAGAALVFIPALGAFAVPDLLGGTDAIMIGNVIKEQFREARDWPFGSALSYILMAFALGAAALAAWLGQRNRVHHELEEA